MNSKPEPVAKGETPGISHDWYRPHRYSQRRDGKNKPCKGPTKMRDPETFPLQTPELKQGDDFSDAVIHAGLQAQADALAPKELKDRIDTFVQAWCISCGDHQEPLELNRFEDGETLFHALLIFIEPLVAQARAEQREQDAPYMQHKAECELADGPTTVLSIDAKSHYVRREGVCTCGLAAIRRSGDGTTP